MGERGELVAADAQEDEGRTGQRRERQRPPEADGSHLGPCDHQPGQHHKARRHITEGGDVDRREAGADALAGESEIEAPDGRGSGAQHHAARLRRQGGERGLCHGGGPGRAEGRWGMVVSNG